MRFLNFLLNDMNQTGYTLIMSFCFQCGTELHSKVPPEDTHLRLVCPSCDYIHYDNPKPVAGVIPIYKDSILLCKRAIEPCYGLWTIPCGYLEMNETVSQGAIREAKEEAGISVENPHLFYVYSHTDIRHIYIIFTAVLDSPVFEAGPESLSCDFFQISNLPWESLAFSSLQAVLKSFVSLYPHYNNTLCH
ncbi:NUDIX hydrolase [Candidatus Marinamargulisbacteria bacterium SCGC AG-343-D04]|nr:NUDIX hydrolase [Candidatus Marinamargulisbacteria bacterium SCGC AG-343-D04]